MTGCGSAFSRSKGPPGMACIRPKVMSETANRTPTSHINRRTMYRPIAVNSQDGGPPRLWNIALRSRAALHRRDGTETFWGEARCLPPEQGPSLPSEIPEDEVVMARHRIAADHVRLGHIEVGVPVDRRDGGIGVDQQLFRLSVELDARRRIALCRCLAHQVFELLVEPADPSGVRSVRVLRPAGREHFTREVVRVRVVGAPAEAVDLRRGDRV